ncbi:MAG: hypothetical protein MHM6MM_002239 [Cercozoa sp. M6MM]
MEELLRVLEKMERVPKGMQGKKLLCNYLISVEERQIMKWKQTIQQMPLDQLRALVVKEESGKTRPFEKRKSEAVPCLYPLVRLVLCSFDKTRSYNMKGARLVRVLGRAFCFSDYAIKSVKEFQQSYPPGKPTDSRVSAFVWWANKLGKCSGRDGISVRDFNNSLNNLSKQSDDKGKSQTLTGLRGYNEVVLKWFMRMILKEMKLGLGDKSYRVLHADADAFAMSLVHICLLRQYSAIKKMVVAITANDERTRLVKRMLTAVLNRKDFIDIREHLHRRTTGQSAPLHMFRSFQCMRASRTDMYMVPSLMSVACGDEDAVSAAEAARDCALAHEIRKVDRKTLVSVPRVFAVSVDDSGMSKTTEVEHIARAACLKGKSLCVDMVKDEDDTLAACFIGLKKTGRVNYFFAEHKYDGERALVHVSSDVAQNNSADEAALRKHGLRVGVFTRQGKNYTKKYGHAIVDMLRGRFRHDDAILDGEILAYDSETNSRLDFGSNKTAAKQHQGDDTSSVESSDERAMHLVLMVFDVLRLNGVDLRDAPLVYRRRVLQTLLRPAVHETKNEVQVVDSVAVRSLSEVQSQLHDAILRHDMEGLVLKDPMSPYIQGKCTRWLKVKVDHLGGLSDTFDCVILAACLSDSAKSYRAGLYSKFYVGVRDDRTGHVRYCILGRVGTGYNAKILKQIQASLRGNLRELTPLEREQFRKTGLHIPFLSKLQNSDGVSGDEPWRLLPKDVPHAIVVDPSRAPVMELACFALVESDDPRKVPSCNTCGITFRFPRFRRFRSDKSARDTTPFTDVLRTFRAPHARVSALGKNFEGEEIARRRRAQKECFSDDDDDDDNDEQQLPEQQPPPQDDDSFGVALRKVLKTKSPTDHWEAVVCGVPIDNKTPFSHFNDEQAAALAAASRFASNRSQIMMSKSPHVTLLRNGDVVDIDECSTRGGLQRQQGQQQARQQRITLTALQTLPTEKDAALVMRKHSEEVDLFEYKLCDKDKNVYDIESLIPKHSKILEGLTLCISDPRLALAARLAGAELTLRSSVEGASALVVTKVNCREVEANYEREKRGEAIVAVDASWLHHAVRGTLPDCPADASLEQLQTAARLHLRSRNSLFAVTGDTWCEREFQIFRGVRCCFMIDDESEPEDSIFRWPQRLFQERGGTVTTLPVMRARACHTRGETAERARRFADALFVGRLDEQRRVRQAVAQEELLQYTAARDSSDRKRNLSRNRDNRKSTTATANSSTACKKTSRDEATTTSNTTATPFTVGPPYPLILSMSD